VKPIKKTTKKAVKKKSLRPLAKKITRKLPLVKKQPAKSKLPKNKPSIKETLKVEQSRVQESKFSAANPYFSGSEIVEELPRSYGKDRLVILTRDYRWIYAYWELNPAKHEDFLNSAKLLRVYDVTRINFNGSNANKFFDIEIPAGLDNWYIDTHEPGRNWCVELGYRGNDGKFVPLLRSNTAATPLEGPSDIVDEEWISLQDLFSQFYETGFNFAKNERSSDSLSSSGIASMKSPAKTVT